ncbi:MAG: sulfatase-like hydrolase/transferase [Niabella sp.]
MMKANITGLIGIAIGCVFLFSCQNRDNDNQNQKPNIIIIYLDDLGYGDLSCYGATSVKTPHVDKLAEGGIRFTDAHCSAATCTPSRYSLLTGSYAFRNKAAILPGDAPLLIRPGTPTIAEMFQKAGYKTGVIGKWHLGLGDGVPDWNGLLRPGPLEIGFDYAFIIPATLDRVPTVYVENNKVPNLDPKDPIVVDYTKKVGNWPTGLERPDMLKFGADTQHSNTITDSISRIGFMTGGKAALWKDQEIPFVFINKVDSFITKNKSTPFFLYFSFTDIHVPRDPNPQFKGATPMGTRGDAIVQMDWSVGQLMNILNKQGLTENTIIVFTSDNGPVLDDGYYDDAENLVGTHDPSGGFRGGKYSAYEAGTRMPTIIYWKGKIKSFVSNAMISQIDFYASFADLVGHDLQTNEAPDSYNMIDVLLGKSVKGRNELLEESFTMSLRQDYWKYIAPQNEPTPQWLNNKKNETGLDINRQLYNLKTDPKEQKNIADNNTNLVMEMQQRLDRILLNPTRKGYNK